MSISGEWLAVGAHGTNETVYMYRQSGRNWYLEDVLPSPQFGGTGFGFKLNLDNYTLAVGAAGGKGKVYIYNYDGASWNLAQTITPSVSVSGDLFGDDVDLDGDRLVVGARGDDQVAINAGALYIFDYDGTQWIESAKLVASDGESADYLGTPIALDGDRVAVGVQSSNFNGQFAAGAIYVFEFDGIQWSETASFSAGGGISGLRFPTSLDLGVDRIVGGSHNVNGTGVVYVYDLIGSVWTETQVLTPDDVQVLDQFGISLEMDGDLLVAGSAQAALGTGRVSVFQDVGGTYVDVVSFDPVGASLTDEVGLSCAIGGNLFAAGGWYFDGNGLMDTGGVWTYSLDDSLCAILTSSTKTISLSDGGTSQLRLALGPEFGGDVFAVVGSISGTDPGFPLGLFQVPLNLDSYFLQTLLGPGSGVLTNSFGNLSGGGNSTTGFTIAPNTDPSLVGLSVSHAGVIFELGPLQYLEVSNPVTITLAP